MKYLIVVGMIAVFLAFILLLAFALTQDPAWSRTRWWRKKLQYWLSAVVPLMAWCSDDTMEIDCGERGNR